MFTKKIVATYLLHSIILILTVLGVGSFFLIWTRQQITKTAHTCKVLEENLREWDRKNTYLATRVAMLTAPTALQSYVMNNNMMAPKSNQIIWLKETASTQVCSNFIPAPTLLFSLKLPTSKDINSY
jgi:uncharacterized protein HemX